MRATVLVRTRAMLAKDDDADPMVPLFRVMFDGVFTDMDDPEDLKAGYERHLEQVRAEIDPGRLVEWQPGDAWEPICRALNLSVPDQPFPHVNSTADYLTHSEVRARAGRDPGQGGALSGHRGPRPHGTSLCGRPVFRAHPEPGQHALRVASPPRDRLTRGSQE